MNQPIQPYARNLIGPDPRSRRSDLSGSLRQRRPLSHERDGVWRRIYGAATIAMDRLQTIDLCRGELVGTPTSGGRPRCEHTERVAATDAGRDPRSSARDVGAAAGCRSRRSFRDDQTAPGAVRLTSPCPQRAHFKIEFCVEDAWGRRQRQWPSSEPGEGHSGRTHRYGSGVGMEKRGKTPLQADGQGRRGPRAG
jgi:hypothetical protein